MSITARAGPGDRPSPTTRLQLERLIRLRELLRRGGGH
jgi:hypothetical protein